MLALSASDVFYFTSCLQSTYFPNFITADLFIEISMERGNLVFRILFNILIYFNEVETL